MDIFEIAFSTAALLFLAIYFFGVHAFRKGYLKGDADCIQYAASFRKRFAGGFWGSAFWILMCLYVLAAAVFWYVGMPVVSMVCVVVFLRVAVDIRFYRHHSGGYSLEL